MAPPATVRRTYHLHNGPIKVAIILLITVAFMFSLTTVLLPKSGGSDYNKSRNEMNERKLGVIGSKPPACVNKCMKCKPCMATVVIPNHKQRRNRFKLVSSDQSHDEDDSYYLLSWKCRCGNKLFHP